MTFCGNIIKLLRAQNRVLVRKNNYYELRELKNNIYVVIYKMEWLEE